MADRKLRHRQREASQGDLRARAKYLLERVRTGQITRDGLLLAAYLGDPPAREALGDEAPDLVEDLLLWTRGLEPFGKPALVLAAHAAARASLDRHGRDDHEPRLAVQATREWLDCPCDQHVAAAADVYGYVCGNSIDLIEKDPFWNLVQAVATDEPEFVRQFTLRAVEYAPTSEPLALREAIRDALVPWALSSA